jgi:nucleoside-diphosphate-sugar epimerase
MSSLRIKDPALPLGAKVLVTGANGYIASHIVDQLLGLGYRVRGTVRDITRHSWMLHLFSGRYPYAKERFELVEVRDLTDPNAFQDALQDVDGVVHTCTFITVAAEDAEKDIEHNTRTATAVLRATLESNHVRCFIFTSSSWAAAWPSPEKATTVTSESWNEAALQKVFSSDADGISIFSAAKVLAEKAVWDLHNSHNPSHMALNTVLPAVVFGPVLAPKHQGIASSSSMIKALHDGTSPEVLSMVQPQYFVDVRDVARLHVAALLHPGCEGKRLFAYAEGFNWDEVLEMLRGMFPERKFAEVVGLGRDETVVERGMEVEVMRDVSGNEEWIELGVCVRDTVESFEGT